MGASEIRRLVGSQATQPHCGRTIYYTAILMALSDETYICNIMGTTLLGIATQTQQVSQSANVGLRYCHGIGTAVSRLAFKKSHSAVEIIHQRRFVAIECCTKSKSMRTSGSGAGIRLDRTASECMLELIK
jgi:hypothetical protein